MREARKADAPSRVLPEGGLHRRVDLHRVGEWQWHLDVDDLDAIPCGRKRVKESLRFKKMKKSSSAKTGVIILPREKR